MSIQLLAQFKIGLESNWKHYRSRLLVGILNSICLLFLTPPVISSAQSKAPIRSRPAGRLARWGPS